MRCSDGNKKVKQQESWFIFIVAFIKLLLWSSETFLNKQLYINYSQNYPYHPLGNKSGCQVVMATVLDKFWRAKELQSLEVFSNSSQPMTVTGMTGPISSFWYLFSKKLEHQLSVFKHKLSSCHMKVVFCLPRRYHVIEREEDSADEAGDLAD